ncbi:hypothetical protein [Streptosporangium sp. 'caverna']|uniref:hypothetical protein n=1 Tax=Streptosporangium sp. 'caverna' TaxID=2202249 RepID=UPI0013A6A5DD|nr:hypothetical protein [Streptosporangium sp. 'caverna']
MAAAAQVGSDRRSWRQCGLGTDHQGDKDERHAEHDEAHSGTILQSLIPDHALIVSEPFAGGGTVQTLSAGTAAMVFGRRRHEPGRSSRPDARRPVHRSAAEGDLSVSSPAASLNTAATPDYRHYDHSA